MGIFKAFDGALSGTLADQWRDIITVDSFDETIAVKPGVRMETNNMRGSNTRASEGVITNGSKIYVPENTFAVVFDSSGIEGIITESGGYEYHNEAKSILSKDGWWNSIFTAIDERFDFGGQPSAYKKIIFLNLREIRNIKFGTRGPLLYHDIFYDTDLEILSHGTFSIQIVKPATFIQNYLPANAEYYDFADKSVTMQIQSELLQSLIVGLNRLSKTYRISDLPAHTLEVADTLKKDVQNVGSWEERYGFELVTFFIQNIEFSKESRELVRQYSSNKMNVDAYAHSSKEAADIAFQQSLAAGVKEHGLGDGAGMIMGMNMVQGSMASVSHSSATIDEQIETVKKLKELLDMGALTEEEFALKKKEIMNL